MTDTVSETVDVKPLTAIQRQKLRDTKRREKEKAKRVARKERETLRKAKRKAKREAKAAPKNKLKLWSECVRSGGKCMVCGVSSHQVFMTDGTPKIDRRGRPVFTKLDAHHVLPKERYPEYRTEVDNGVCLCPIHHKYGKFSAHRNPLWFALWLSLNRPEQYAWCVKRLGFDATAASIEPGVNET